MKKTLAILCLVGSTVALSACDTIGSGSYQSRTATYNEDGTQRVAPATRVFRRAQTK